MTGISKNFVSFFVVRIPSNDQERKSNTMKCFLVWKEGQKLRKYYFERTPNSKQLRASLASPLSFFLFLCGYFALFRTFQSLVRVRQPIYSSQTDGNRAFFYIVNREKCFHGFLCFLKTDFFRCFSFARSSELWNPQ